MDKRYITTPVLERLMRKVEFDTNGGCWLWTGGTNTNGYGLINTGRSPSGKMTKTHRVSWEQHRGPLKEGDCVLHKCDVRLCCNPDHLFVGTKRDNTHDMMRKGRHYTGVAWPSER